MLLPDIYIAATIVTAIAVLSIGLPLFHATPSEERRFLLILAAAMLPMNALAFHAVRIPVDAWLSDLMGKGNDQYRYLTTWYAPLTEEPAKLWPLLIPWFRSRVSPSNKVRVALAIGLGFGIGEAWNIAFLLAKVPEISKYPWYMLGGYAGERLMVCIMHAGFTYAALHLILRGKVLAAMTGIFLAMGLHYLVNFPIYVAHLNPWSLSRETWTMLLSGWVLFTFLAMGGILARAAFGARWLEALFRGTMTCPGCGVTYRRPIFRVNLFHKCYERCTACGKWHLVDLIACDEHEQPQILDSKPE